MACEVLGSSFVAPRSAAPVGRSALRSLHGRLVRSFLATSGRHSALSARRALPPPGIPSALRFAHRSPRVSARATVSVASCLRCSVPALPLLRRGFAG